MSSSDYPEFIAQIQMPAGTSLDGTTEVALKVGERIQREVPEMDKISTIIGMNTQQQLQANFAQFGLSLVKVNQRKRGAGEIKEQVRKLLNKEFAFARPKVSEYSLGMTTMAPFYLNLIGNNLDVLDEYAQKLAKEMKEGKNKIADLTDIDTSSEEGKPEYQIQFSPNDIQKFGIMPAVAGAELRYHVAGEVVGELHAKGLQYDVRLRLKPEQRDLRGAFNETKIPNQMYRLVPLSAISKGVEKTGPSQILREDRSRVVQITANLTSNGAIGAAMDQSVLLMKNKIPPPKGVTYNFIGQTEDLKELITNITFAMILAVVFIYFILSSLYESFITPITILIALPPALSGAFLALFLFGQMLTMFSMIGMVMLMGLVTKNSILLVDFALDGYRSGMTRKEAIHKAGMTRLRPILMTTFAMLAGTLPVALGIGEVSKFRMSMGIAIIGGLVLSTFLTLIVVPAMFEYIDIFREWIEGKFRPKYKIPLTDVIEEIEEIEEETITISSNPGPGGKKSLKNHGRLRKSKKI
jgi:HAE1 family hydrophobic/amphiphilic exporter-1